MKVTVAGDLEEHDLARVHHMSIDPEPADGGFQPLNIRRPRVGEKVVSCRDRHGPAAAALLRFGENPRGAVFAT
jgi:hypothetical protein